ncbi:TPA: hypothetical protein DEP90_01705 [Patescibacteria group bacterium]|nr:hypothetical protein [Patescibacteria group bacterium]
MARISREILEKIEKEDIKPIGRWSFVLRNYILWTLFVLNILFGSIGFALTIFLFDSSDAFELILSVNDLFEVLILAIPMVWVVLTILFVVIAYLNFRYTDKGYKLSFVKLVITNTLMIMVLGYGIYSMGLPRYINGILAERIPEYARIVDPRYRVWDRPEQGYLAGEIVSLKESLEGEYIMIIDLNGEQWSVNITDAQIRRAVSLRKGEKIKAYGNMFEDNTFKASDVLPWEGRGRRMQEIYH